MTGWKASHALSTTLIKPTESWQTVQVHLANPTDFKVDENFYVVPKPVDARP